MDMNVSAQQHSIKANDTGSWDFLTRNRTQVKFFEQ